MNRTWRYILIHSLSTRFTSHGQYVAKVSVGGQELILAVDTGSSDLWVHTPYQLNITSQTDIAINLSYGIGSASGQIVYGPMYLGAFFVPEQVFLNVDKVEQQSGEGILGLGLASLSSTYKQADKNRTAQPAIYNIFDQNPTSSNFVALSIERSGDMERTSGGVLSINEYDPRFAIVANSPKLPLAPTNSCRWTIAMDMLHMNGQYYNLSSQVQGAALNTSIALIDSGTSLAYAPISAVDFIYGSIEGAVHLQDFGKNVWVVPCLEPANLTISFGGTSFPINPLELTTFQTIVENGQKWTVCMNAIQPQLAVGSGDLDFLLGDIFMRNVYSMCVFLAYVDIAFLADAHFAFYLAY
ncbi:hypothetical protein PILCRDRAFT_85591 [Piloderma croceum F 1598]|uniref:Peptidase A1 domain-containing protein n=1 Tax=Piloderma croceum (strain F 1598) TaxID=765440 RepID=A0A0C3CFG0_PILCF|nr:hypothetical protein PILCRDRAFT_85591 [Piloderma croceum F 1598]